MFVRLDLGCREWDLAGILWRKLHSRIPPEPFEHARYFSLQFVLLQLELVLQLRYIRAVLEPLGQRLRNLVSKRVSEVRQPQVGRVDSIPAEDAVIVPVFDRWLYPNRSYLNPDVGQIERDGTLFRDCVHAVPRLFERSDVDRVGTVGRMHPAEPAGFQFHPDRFQITSP